MRITNKISSCLIFFILAITVPIICRAEVLVSVTGMSTIEGNNYAKAEQHALQDAFTKASLQIALKYVPNSSIEALIKILPEFASARGIQDVVQYQITSRTQQGGVLQLSVDVRMNDASLREWISSHALSTPRELRPRILLMISSLGSGKTKTYEWWNEKSRNAYSPFEVQLAQDLKHLGENVMDLPQALKWQRPTASKPLDIARYMGADYLLTGSISNIPVINRIYECSLRLTLLDVKSQSTLSSWTITHKGDLPLPLMYSLMIDEIAPPIRLNISSIIFSHAPVAAKKSLCIEGISNYNEYQSIINALKTMGSVTRISVVSISGHSICHAVEVKGTLSDVMENLRNQKIAEADILVEDERAFLRILRN